MNGHQSSNNPDNLPHLVTIDTKTHQLPFNSCWNVHILHNLPLILITSPAAIMNLPINFICPLDITLVLTTILSTPPLFLSRTQPSGSYTNLSCGTIFTLCSHTFTLLNEKDNCDCRNISVKLPHLYMHLSSRDHFIFSKRFLFLFLFLCYFSNHFSTLK